MIWLGVMTRYSVVAKKNVSVSMGGNRGLMKGTGATLTEEVVVANGGAQSLVTETGGVALEAILARHVRRHFAQSRENNPADS